MTSSNSRHRVPVIIAILVFIAIIVILVIWKFSKPELTPDPPVAEGKGSNYWSNLIEGRPDDIPDLMKVKYKNLLEDRSRILSKQVVAGASLSQTDFRIRAVIDHGQTWQPGSTVTVAFLPVKDEITNPGPDSGQFIDKLRCKIEKLAIEWVDSPPHKANLKLSFRDAQGMFREWKEGESTHSAQIRIKIDTPEEFGSLTGKEAEDKLIIGKPSMKLKKIQKDLADPEWMRLIQHEFGHALGLWHDHQDPNGEFKAAIIVKTPDNYKENLRAGSYIPDDNGISPGAYLWFSEFPNNKSSTWVDEQVLALPPSGKCLQVSFDTKSIMRYYLPIFLFKPAEQGKFGSAKNYAISDLDKEAIRRFYPFEKEKVKKIAEFQNSFKMTISGK